MRSLRARPRNIFLQYACPMAQRYDPWAIIVCKLYALQRLSAMPPIQVVLRLPVTPAWRDRIGSKQLQSFREVMRRFVTEADYPILRHEVLWPHAPPSSPVRWEAQPDFEEVIIELDKVQAFRPVPSFPPRSSPTSASLPRLFSPKRVLHIPA